MEARAANATFHVRATMVEIYNEEIKDLLAAAGGGGGGGGGAGAAGGRPIAIREAPDGSIRVFGAREEEVTSCEDLIRVLQLGALCRCAGRPPPPPRPPPA